MAAIRSEHETQNRTIHGQKSALDGIILELGALRVVGKEPETTSVPQSLCGTPGPDGMPVLPDSDAASMPDSTFGAPFNAGEVEEDKRASTPQEASSEGIVGDNDIEMGEVEEDPKEKSRKKSRDELEEGEATDASSELSDPPDD